MMKAINNANRPMEPTFTRKPASGLNWPGFSCRREADGQVRGDEEKTGGQRHGLVQSGPGIVHQDVAQDREQYAVARESGQLCRKSPQPTRSHASG